MTASPSRPAFATTGRISSPRAASALRLASLSRWVLDPDAKVVVRGGGGIYYDRFGSGPLLDLVRYRECPPPLHPVLV